MAAPLTRRTFMATSLVTGMTAAQAVKGQMTSAASSNSGNYPASQGSPALYPKLPLPEPDFKLTKTFSLGKSTLNEGETITACHWGIIRAQVHGGKIVGVTPFEYDYAPSPNLNGIANLPYTESRIRYPAVRETYLHEGVSSRERRGHDKFVRVSWDEALNLVVKEIDRIYGQYGPSAMYGRSYGWMSTGKVNAAIPLQQRLLNLMGGFIPTVNSYSTAAIGTILPYVIGEGDPLSTSWCEILKHTELIVFWGCDPLVTNDVDWSTTLHNNYGYFRALKEKGIKTISINPLNTDTAQYLGSEWVAPIPGSDCALMLGMIHELNRSGEADRTFLNKYTSGYPRLLAYIQGEEDGIVKSPQWAAIKTGIPAEKIVSLAREMKRHRTMIMMGWGIQRIQYGEQPPWMGFALASVLGQIGLPGGGIGTNYHYCSGGSPMATGPYLSGIGSNVRPARPIQKPWKGSRFIPVARFVDCFLNPGKTINYNGTRITYPDVHMVMWAGGNPFSHQPQTFQLEKAWKNPETVVVTDNVWSSTARHADIVLPSCTFFEHNDITSIGTYTNDGIVAMKQVIEPQFESKSDYWIFSELAKRLGVEKQFTQGLDEMGWIRHLYEVARNQGEFMGAKLPSFEKFWDKGYILFPVSPETRNYVSFADFRRDPQENPLNTESGLIQLFSPRIAGFNYSSCKGYPSYIEPTESLLTPNKNFPLAYISCKSRYRLHSQLDGTSAHNMVDIDNREPIWIHPENAKVRGIENGDIVLVKNNRGRLMAVAYVTDRVRKDVVVVHHGAWFEPQDIGLTNDIDIHGASNAVTMDVPTSDLACGNIASGGLVEVEKFVGDLPDVKIFGQPPLTKK